MFIQTEYTPNPATLKFLPGRAVMPSGTADDIGRVYATFLADGEDKFVKESEPRYESMAPTEAADTADTADKQQKKDIEKFADKEWAVVKPAVLGAIMDHYTSGKPIVVAGSEAPKAIEADGENAELVQQIIELIDTRVRPAVAQDGGDIIFKDFKDGVVTLHMQGSCSGCPSSTATLKMGIENMLKHYIPEVLEVRAEA